MNKSKVVNSPKFNMSKSLLNDKKPIYTLCAIILACLSSLPSFAQRDSYSMTIKPYEGKPELQFFQVRLKGDYGVSLIDLDGNIIARNFTPITDSYGKVEDSNWGTPVIDDIFCVVRYKSNSNWRDTRRSMTIYKNASSPIPIPGLTDLYSANIINPNLFPISRYGERIKFVNKDGKEKFTVMPIDGKEPTDVDPIIINGLIIVEVENAKRGVINTMGKWVIYPEWDNIKLLADGTILGLKINGGIYKIVLNGNMSKATRFNSKIDYYDYCRSNGKYFAEEFCDNGISISNIYDKDQKYKTTLNNADFIRFNLKYRNLLLVRYNFRSSLNNHYDRLIDVSKNNAFISKRYSCMEELPDGNYLAYNRTSNEDVHECWYVKADGTEIALPNNTESPLRHPCMALFYHGTLNKFIVKPTSEKVGYICDNKGNKVGNLEIQEYFNSEWEVEPVKSSYYRINIIDKKN